MYVYIFSATSISVIYKINQNNNEEERSSGTKRTGVSQKDLQINEKTEKVKNAKRTRALRGIMKIHLPEP